MNIVLEYAEQGSLAQRLKRDGPFAEPAIAAYLVQILHGLCYLHSKSIVHCDMYVIGDLALPAPLSRDFSFLF